MIKKLLTILVLCGTIKVYAQNPAEVLKIITKRTGIKTDHITVESRKLQRGYEAVTCNPHLIVVNTTQWNLNLATENYSTMLHEVGHTYGGLHRDDYMKFKEPASIMFPSSFPDFIFRKHLKYYEADLIKLVYQTPTEWVWEHVLMRHETVEECIKEIKDE